VTVPTVAAGTYPCKHTDTYSSGKVIWYGTLYRNVAAATAYWDLFSTGYVRNPNGGADYQKTLRATIPVVPVTTQPLNNPSWNYIFSRNTGSGLPLSGCDMTLQNSVNVTSPLYVMGNLCLKNTAKISKGPLIVKGSLDLQQSGNQAGAPAPSSTRPTSARAAATSPSYSTPSASTDWAARSRSATTSGRRSSTPRRRSSRHRR
jgi:hypothetical protein